MKEIIISNLSKSKATHKNEHPSYEYIKHEVTDSREKYEIMSPNEGYQMVVAFYTIPPGKSNYPYHYHTTNEETFYIISGCGVIETTEGIHPITTGDVIICPVGKNGAHKITNTSESESLIYLDVDTNNTPDIAFYPHSNKVGIRASGGIHDNYDLNCKIGYYDNEK